jgi:hypothetical protein
LPDSFDLKACADLAVQLAVELQQAGRANLPPKQLDMFSTSSPVTLSSIFAETIGLVYPWNPARKRSSPVYPTTICPILMSSFYKK